MIALTQMVGLWIVNDTLYVYFLIKGKVAIAHVAAPFTYTEYDPSWKSLN